MERHFEIHPSLYYLSVLAQVAHWNTGLQRCCYGVKSPEWPGACSVGITLGDGNRLDLFPISPFSGSDMLTSTLTCFVMAYSGD